MALTQVASGLIASVAASTLTGTQTIPKSTLPTGSVLQVAQATLAGTQAVSGSSAWTDITSLSVTITPTASTSKFLISFAVNMQGENNSFLRFTRNGTAVGVGNADGSKSLVSAANGYYGTANGYQTVQLNAQYLDSPATASAITYKVQGYANNSAGTGAFYINYSSHEGDNAGSSRAMSTLTVMEIAA